MKKNILLNIILILLLGSLTVSCAQAVNEDHMGYLIIVQNFCIIVRTPAKQLTSSVGRTDLGIVLKDKTTQIMMSGGYFTIAVPVTKIEATIKKYHLQNLTLIE